MIPDSHHFRILGYNIYVFFHEEQQSLKSAKWEARAFREKLVGFNGHTIHRAQIEDQNTVIWVKHLRIYNDITSMAITFPSDFEGRPTFDRIQVQDEQSPSDKSSASDKEKNAHKKPPKKPTKVRKGREEENNKASEEENAPESSPQKPIKNRVSRTNQANCKEAKRHHHPNAYTSAHPSLRQRFINQRKSLLLLSLLL